MPDTTCRYPAQALALACLTAIPAAAADADDAGTIVVSALRAPGISLSRNGGFGIDTAPRIRGANLGQRGGARLAAALRAVRAAEPRFAGLTVEEMPCLFACQRHCAVQVRAPGRIGYVLGDFTPDEASARAILDFAAHHAESEHGQVPYALWHDGVKGHFIVRTPPEAFIAT